jgi:hypothetical protein
MIGDDGWSPYHVIICDDIRQEIGGKQTLIGTYNEVMIVPAIPAILPSIAFRVAINMSRTDYKTCQFKLSSPGGSPVIQSGGNVQVQRTDEYVSFVFQSTIVTMPELGEYPIEFGLDENRRRVGRLVVRLPNTDEERSKLAS